MTKSRLHRYKTAAFIAVLFIIGYLMRGWLAATARELMDPAGAYSRLMMVGLALVCVLFLAMIIWLSWRRHRDRRDMNDVMRVAERANRAAAKPAKAAPGTTFVETPRQTRSNAPEQSRPFPQLNVIAGGRAAPDTATPPRTRLKPLLRELYLQPVLSIPDYAIIGYDVFRARNHASIAGRKQFFQTLAEASSSKAAAFEFAMVEQAASAARQVVCLPGASGEGARLFVHVTGALLDDSTLWEQTVSLFKAHSGLRKNLVICIPTAALETQMGGADRRRSAAAMARTGAELAATGLPEAISGALPTWFNIFTTVIMDRDLVAGIEAFDGDPMRHTLLQEARQWGQSLFLRGAASDSDIADMVDAGADMISGDQLASPRKLRAGKMSDPDRDVIGYG